MLVPAGLAGTSFLKGNQGAGIHSIFCVEQRKLSSVPKDIYTWKKVSFCMTKYAEVLQEEDTNLKRHEVVA